MIDQIDIKYFKLAVGKNTRGGDSDISCNCPLCDDNKGRLHLYKNDSMEMALAHCFNAGCVLEEQHHGMIKFLGHVANTLVPQYKKEKFKDNIKNIAEGNNLNDILATVNKKIEPKKIEPIKIEEAKSAKKEYTGTPEIPQMFLDMLSKAKDIPEAVKYIHDRRLDVKDDWLFSRDKFVNIFDKSYFVENFLFIPLWQNNKLRGFYTRCITEKRFSTIIFPKGEKYWCNNDFKEEETCYIFEGIMDALSSGLNNTVAMLSADLPDEFLEELKEPIFCFDNDSTGIKKALKYNKLGYKTFVWPETREKDMNEILQKGGSLDGNKRMIEAGVHSGLKAQVLLNLSNR